MQASVAFHTFKRQHITACEHIKAYETKLQHVLENGNKHIQQHHAGY